MKKLIRLINGLLTNWQQRLFYKNKIGLLVSPQCLRGICIETQNNTQIDNVSEIGSYTYIGKNCNVTRSKIGRYVSIGNNVTVGPGEHDLKKVSTSSIFYRSAYDELTQDKCIIESDAWIGVDAVILRSVRIGFGAVVAANAVVTKDVPDYAIVAGVPAKIISYRFSEDRIKKLLLSQWWNLELEDASAYIENFDN